MFIEQLRAAIAALYDERSALITELDGLGAEGETRSADEITARADEITARATEIKDDLAAKEARLAELVELDEARNASPKSPNFIRKPDAPAVDDVRNMDARQLTDVMARSFEANDIDGTEAMRTIKRHRGDREWITNIAARSTDAYTAAFGKVMTGREMFLTDEERAAVAVGTSTQGGLLVPTHLDPTLIVTNNGTANVIRQISRVVTLTRENTWNGVTTAGSNFSWDAELTEVSDDSPTFAAAQIPTYVGAGFIQASYQAFEDIENLAGDVAMLLNDGRDRLEATAHATGAGSTAPTGIFTALDANTNVEVTSTTAATIGLVDLQAIRRGVPIRFRNRGVFVTNPLFADAIKLLESQTYTPNISTGAPDQLLSRPLYETDDAPAVVSTNVKDNEVIYGDFSNYVIVDKPGSATLDFIPNLFSTTTNLPDGRRGWYMRFRSGADSVNDLAFRMLQDKTST